MEKWEYLIERLESIDQKFDTKLDKILVQTTKTNGRVNSLEEKVNDHDEMLQQHNNIVNYNKGREKIALVILGGISAVSVGVITYLITELIKSK